LTFEEYCRERWDFAANYARRLIHSCLTVENIKSVPIGTIPTTESQTRPLARPDADTKALNKFPFAVVLYFPMRAMLRLQ